MAEEDSGEQVGRKELLANIRRLTIAVLDNLEEGSRDKTLDQGEKRCSAAPAPGCCGCGGVL